MSPEKESGCIPCSNCFVTVPQDKWYAVENFGKYTHMLHPGLAFAGVDCLGCCINFRSITSRVTQDVCEVHTKTKDNVFVNVQLVVQKSVIPAAAEQAIYKLTNAHEQIVSYVSDVVRSQVPRIKLDEAFENKDFIADACQDQVAEKMATYGFTIHRVLVTQFVPDAAVEQSMNEINRQRRLCEANAMAAEAEKIQLVKRAEATADAHHIYGQGIARERAAIIEGLRRSLPTGESLSTEEISELLLVTQYFEKLREIGAQSGAQTLFVPYGPGGVTDVVSQIRHGRTNLQTLDRDSDTVGGNANGETLPSCPARAESVIKPVEGGEKTSGGITSYRPRPRRSMEEILDSDFDSGDGDIKVEQSRERRKRKSSTNSRKASLREKSPISRKQSLREKSPMPMSAAARASLKGAAEATRGSLQGVADATAEVVRGDSDSAAGQTNTE